MTENNNAADWFVDRHVREGRGDKTAFREAGSGRTLSYAELSTQTAKFAAALQHAGIAREERLACLVLDQIEYPVIFFGAMKAGVIPVLLNTLLTADFYDAILRDSRATTLIVSEALWPVVRDVIPENPHLASVIVVGAGPDGTESYAEFMQGPTGQAPGTKSGDGPGMAPVEVSPDDTAFWLYSSGSTGQPKGVRHVHSAMRATADTYGAQVLQIREDDVVLSAAKIFFAYGLGNALSFPLSVGATTILWGGRPTPDGMADFLASEQPTVFCGVPTLYAAMVAHMEKAGVPEHCVRLCISAGEALPAGIGNAWQALIGAPILDGVGSTEMLHIFLSNRVDDLEYGTSGLAVPGYDLRLVDEQGAEVAAGEVGELLVNGASAADGYWNQRHKSRATFAGEWTHTGDKYERRADGRYIYCGRTDDMFKVSGIWVSPFEVEQAISAHDAVLEAAVVPALDDQGLEKPKAFVVLKDKTAAPGFAEAIKPFVQDRIGKWKYPRWVEIVEDLPKTATGKIQRFKLRQ